MTRRPVRNLAASVHDRLLARAKAEDRPFDELLQYYAIERFLFRLSRSPHAGRFVLKGALMLQFWGGALTRSTRDVDLAGVASSTVPRMLAVVRDCLEAKVEDDGLRFDAGSLRSEEIRLDANYRGVRVVFRAYLGKAEVRLQVDVGFGDVIVPAPLQVVYPSLLGLEEPRLFGTTPETAIAEKLQAMVVLDVANTRMKDFLDLWLLASGREFRGETLAGAIRATFARRKTALPEEPPVALTLAFAETAGKQVQWKGFLRRARIQGAPPELLEVVDLIGDFVMPAVNAARRGTAFRRRWPPGGPWREP